jgi:hypothetical protein
MAYLVLRGLVEPDLCYTQTSFALAIFGEFLPDDFDQHFELVVQE